MLGLHIAESTIRNLELMVFGGLIIFFLIVEPHGLARLWQIGKEKLRLWPFHTEIWISFRTTSTSPI